MTSKLKLQADRNFFYLSWPYSQGACVPSLIFFLLILVSVHNLSFLCYHSYVLSHYLLHNLEKKKTNLTLLFSQYCFRDKYKDCLSLSLPKGIKAGDVMFCCLFLGFAFKLTTIIRAFHTNANRLPNPKENPVAKVHALPWQIQRNWTWLTKRPSIPRRTTARKSRITPTNKKVKHPNSEVTIDLQTKF